MKPQDDSRELPGPWELIPAALRCALQPPGPGSNPDAFPAARRSVPCRPSRRNMPWNRKMWGGGNEPCAEWLKGVYPLVDSWELWYSGILRA